MFAGSGLKGALRHHFSQAWPSERERGNAGLINRLFGPDTNASDFAGALSLSDAQLVALPVRSLRNGFAYVTSPLALARLQRLAGQAGVAAPWSIPSAEADKAKAASANLLSGSALKQQLVLEAFEFSAQVDPALASIAAWLAQHALSGDGQSYFAEKLKTDLILLHDSDFAHFARHAMVVEPHVRINDDSGTADDGGLFYVENLPPETLMVGMAQASVERFKKDSRGSNASPLLDAAGVLQAVLAGNDECPGIDGQLLQIGGDASTGRGLVVVHAAQAEGN
jgi:CRISPR-associated protein Cmr4